MTDPASASPPPAGPRHPLARAALRIPALILVTIYFLIDDVVLAAIRPIVARLAELRLFARLAEAIHRLPPYPTLVLFLHGRELARQSGAIGQADIVRWTRQHL